MSNSKVQGEGDYKSAQRYNEKTKDFVESTDTDALATSTDHTGDASEEELARARQKARERSKADDSQ